MRMPESKVESGETAHGKAGDVRLVYPEVIEHSLDFVRSEHLRIGRGALGYARWRIAPRIKRHGAIALAEVPQLRLPTSQVSREFMHEDERPACSGLFAEEADTVGSGGVRHIQMPAA